MARPSATIAPEPTTRTLKNLSVVDPTLAPPSEALAAVLERLGEAVRHRRILLKPFFQDFDHHHNGRTTQTQFAQVLSVNKLSLSPDDLRLLYQRYADPILQDMNYLAFVREIEALADGAAPEETVPVNEVPAPVKRAGANPVDYEALVRKLQAHVRRTAVRVTEFFKDHDKLRSGYVSSSLFERCCANAGLPMSPAECQCVMSTFEDCGDRPGQIHWMPFCDLLDQVFTQKGLGQTPTAEPTRWTPPPEETTPPLTPRRLAAAQGAIARLHDAVIKLRILIKPSLQDYDRLRNGHISGPQFKAAMGTLGLALSDLERDALVERFSDRFGFRYRDFGAAVESGSLGC